LDVFIYFICFYPFSDNNTEKRKKATKVEDNEAKEESNKQRKEIKKE
jgi:hypothetical protein